MNNKKISKKKIIEYIFYISIKFYKIWNLNKIFVLFILIKLNLNLVYYFHDPHPYLKLNNNYYIYIIKNYLLI